MKGTWLADLLDMTYSTGNVTFGVTDGEKLPAGPVKAKGTFSEIPVEATSKFSEMADAYLYLGPRDLLLNEPTPAEIFLDKDYMTELQRRTAIMGGGPITDQASPEKVSDRDSNPFFCDPEELKKLVPLGGNSSQQGKKDNKLSPKDCQTFSSDSDTYFSFAYSRRSRPSESRSGRPTARTPDSYSGS
jgi:hypothetical protein